jgi:RNA polymerase-associated protein LEO1
LIADLLLRQLHRTQRELDDEELDSGDDEGRMDRVGVGEEADLDGRPEDEVRLMDAALGRHAIPYGSDGEVSHLITFVMHY